MKAYLHKGQCEVLNHPARFKVVVAGRRWGKTVVARDVCIIKASGGKKRKVWYIAPTYKMAKGIMWEELLDAIPRSWIKKIHHTELAVTLKNNSKIECKGADKPDCYDDQTEILTKNGWVKFANLSKDVDVLTFNPETSNAEWQRPYKYVDQHYEGTMHRIKSKKLDLLVTPEHKFLVDNRKGVRKLRTIESISQHQDRIPAKCGWGGSDISRLTEDLCAVIGFYLAEGCAYGNSGGDRYNRGWPVTFCQTEGVKGGTKGDVRIQFKKILDRLGFSYRETKIGLNVQSKELWELLYPLGNTYTKRIPREWMELPTDKLKVMLHWMLMGDGSVRQRDRRYYTVSKGLADDVQELAIKSGESANIVEKKQRTCFIDGRKIESTTPLYEVRLYRNSYNFFRDSKESYVSQEKYAGKVYCVGVKNHVIMVRRNGCICWSGNTLRGVGLYFVCLDEFQDMKLDVWTRVIRPTLAKDRGHALIIGTPKGYANLYDVYKLGQDPTNLQWKSWQFPTITSPFIPVEEIEAARKDMDIKSFRQEFEASFETMAGRVYYAFDRNKHVGDYAFDPSLPIWVCQDFNVDPMATVIAQPQRTGEVWAIDELYLHDSNTLAVCEEIERRYWRYMNSIVVYPDPACVNRGSARGESDLDIFRARGFKRLKYRRKHPLIVDRVNAVNHLLEDAAGNSLLKIDRKCVRLVESFEQLLYKQGTRDVDKGQNIEHITDALGYMIELEHALRKIKVMGVSI